MKIMLNLITSLFVATAMAETLSYDGESQLERFDKSWMISLQWNQASTSFSNLEKTSTGQNGSYGETTRIDRNSLGLLFLKEFWENRRVSMTTFVGLASIMGEGERKNTGGYKQNVKGTEGSLGVSANANFYGLGFKIQPYLGLNGVYENSEYQLEYNGSASVVTHDYEGQNGFAQVGVRVLDPQLGMMSYFGIDYRILGNETSRGQIQNGNSPISLGKSEITVNELIAKLGFGFLF